MSGCEFADSLIYSSQYTLLHMEMTEVHDELSAGQQGVPRSVELGGVIESKTQKFNFSHVYGF